MRTFKIFILAVMATTLLFGCSSSTDNNSDTMADLGNVGPVDPVDPGGSGSDNEIAINPNRPYYDVVIMDQDRWELCLNLNRSRAHCNSYTGHLWYQAGAFIFEGTLSGNYNHQLDMFSCTALDSGWDRGHIFYAMQFIEGTNDLYGSYCYFEFPRRTNGINAWLEQGQMGPHIYGQEPPPDPSFFNPPSAIHPKGGRSLEEMAE